MYNKKKSVFGYIENKDDLRSRIKTHSKFGNFNLHKWIKNKFNIQKGSKVLDLGCGDGSYTKIFKNKVKKNGLIVGVDKNLNLLKVAKKRFKKIPQNISYKYLNFDKNWKINHNFDWIFCIYALHHSNNFSQIIYNIKKILNKNGTLVIIGPGKKNSEALYNIHYHVTGKKAPKTFIKKMGRTEKEFHFKLKKSFNKKYIKKFIFNYKIFFPQTIAYAKYYWSTLLWRQEMQKLKITRINYYKNRTVKYLTLKKYKSINKQTVCLICR